MAVKIINASLVLLQTIILNAHEKDVSRAGMKHSKGLQFSRLTIALRS